MNILAWLRSVVADGGSLKRSGNAIVSYLPVSTTGSETLTNKTLTSPAINTPTITTPSYGNGMSEETATASTTDGTVTTVWSKTLADNTVYELSITLVGRRTDSAGRAVYRRRVLVYVQGGTLTVGSPDTIGTDVETTAGYDITIDNSGLVARVRATGNAGHSIKWNARVVISSDSS